MQIFLFSENECLTDNGGCHQICKDTFESFECMCKAGFFLESDGYTCNGKFHDNDNLQVTQYFTILLILVTKGTSFDDFNMSSHKSTSGTFHYTYI